MNNNINHFNDDDIEILDDIDEQPTPSSDDVYASNEDVRRQVDETVRSQLNAFSNQRLYNNTYANPQNGTYGYNQPRAVSTQSLGSNDWESPIETLSIDSQDADDDSRLEVEHPVYQQPIMNDDSNEVDFNTSGQQSTMDDDFIGSMFNARVNPTSATTNNPIPQNPMPEVNSIPEVNPMPINPVMPEAIPTPVVNQTPTPKPVPLEKTTEMMTIPELEKTAVYPSGVIPIEKNEPADDSDKSSNKSTKALMFIIGLFVVLALVIFIVLPLINPV